MTCAGLWFENPTDNAQGLTVRNSYIEGNKGISSIYINSGSILSTHTIESNFMDRIGTSNLYATHQIYFLSTNSNSSVIVNNNSFRSYGGYVPNASNTLLDGSGGIFYYSANSVQDSIEWNTALPNSYNQALPTDPSFNSITATTATITNLNLQGNYLIYNNILQTTQFHYINGTNLYGGLFAMTFNQAGGVVHRIPLVNSYMYKQLNYSIWGNIVFLSIALQFDTTGTNYNSSNTTTGDLCLELPPQLITQQMNKQVGAIHTYQCFRNLDSNLHCYSYYNSQYIFLASFQQILDPGTNVWNSNTNGELAINIMYSLI